MDFIAAEPPETRIVLVGHSWGGDTAAKVAARLGEQGRPVDTLIAVDPVGGLVPDGFFGRVRAGSRQWVNINARGGPANRSDLIAVLGGKYADGPRGFATRHIEAPLYHEDFSSLLRAVGPAGVSGFDRMLGR